MADEWAAVLQKGKKYRIRYMLAEQRRVREMVATFIDWEKAPLSRSGQPDLVLSGRPVFGTTKINLSHVTDRPIEVVDTMECYYDRRV